jgi:hypothetical protein
VNDLVKANSSNSSERVSEVERPEPDEDDSLVETRIDAGTDWSSVPAHYLLIILLGFVLWGYRTADAWTLGIAIGAVVVPLVASRVDRIRKLTSKLVSFETRPLLQARRKAERATSQAERAAEEARSTAQRAHTAAEEAQKAASGALQAAAGASALASQVAETLRVLQAATIESASLLAEGVAKRGKVGTAPPFGERLALAKKLEGRLRSIGCSEEEAAEATRPLYLSVSFDLAKKALGRCYRALSERHNGGKVPDEFEADYNALTKKSSAKFQTASQSEIQTLAEIQALAEKYGIFDDAKLGVALRDFETFSSTRQLPPQTPSSNADDELATGESERVIGSPRCCPRAPTRSRRAQ